jgi:hypothetical protein
MLELSKFQRDNVILFTMDDQVTAQQENINLSMTPLQVAIYERLGRQGDAKELFELYAHERHRETNEAEYFSGPTYL